MTIWRTCPKGCGVLWVAPPGSQVIPRHACKPKEVQPP